VKSVKPIAKAKARRQKLAQISTSRSAQIKDKGWAIIGFDTSTLSIAGAAFGYDRVLNRYVGPKFSMLRWTKDDHYFNRLKAAAKAESIIQELQAELSLFVGPEQIYIYQEEPWPMGASFTRKGISQSMKQQAEVSGAFLGGLIRFGYQNVTQLNSMRWRKIVADDLGITVHHSKWRDPELCATYNCKPADTGKFRTKQWALKHTGFQRFFPEEIPNWPDIITRPEGKVPRPKGSFAKAIQPDDRYDALAIAWTGYRELGDADLLSENPYAA
jgi:hypothetical protein